LAAKQYMQVKYLIPFLARTNFATLYSLLPQQQKDAFRVHPKALVDAVVSVANQRAFNVRNEFNGKANVDVAYDTNYSPDTALVRDKDLGLSMLTIDKWITGILQKNVDYLNAVNFKILIKEETGDSEGPVARLAARNLESVAMLGKDTSKASTHTDAPDVVGHTPLAIFENRFITGFRNARTAHEEALSYLLFYKALKEGKGTPGEFPQITLFR
jgi:hypothetical protein